MNDHVRHHFIPQFIIKNFCSSHDGFLSYFDKTTGKLGLKNKEDIFVTPNLYKDESDQYGDPQQIEKDLSKFESDMAPIIKRLLTGDTIEITEDEVDSLKLFFAIMAFRSKRTYLHFLNMDPDSKDFFGQYQKDGDIGAFWKRNLGLLTQHRLYRDVIADERIDFPIKIFMFRDTQALLGMYPIIVERRGQRDFLLGDTYPTVQTGEGPDGFPTPMYSFYPLSPNRMLVLAANGVQWAGDDVRLFDKSVLVRPFPKAGDRDTIILKVKKIYEPTVRELNELAADTALEGYAMQNPMRCL